MTPIARRRFPIMGTRADLLVVGSGVDDLADEAQRLLQELHNRWSRFSIDSEISRLNRRETLYVSEETFDLITKAVHGHSLTDGRFDPTLGRQLCQLGYDRTFEAVDQSATPRSNMATGNYTGTRHGAEQIELDEHRRSVLLPVGVSFDPGGIGKGLAADLVAERLNTLGAEGVLVNLGGDLRVTGKPAYGDRWVISINEPAVSSRPLATIELVEGAVATSTTARRRWGNDRHHLLDPRTGRPSDGPILATAVAGAGWWAEVAATALMSPHPASITDCAALRVYQRPDGELQHEHDGPFSSYEVAAKA